MKKCFIYIAVAFIGLGLASCYQDQSTEATMEIPEIQVRVDGAEADTLSVAYGETLSLKAVTRQTGYSNSDFVYKWEFDYTPGSMKNRLEIGDESQLEYLVANLPSSDPYYLSLTITNTKIDYTRLLYWPVYVTNPYGDGLLVAHTKDGGQTSDLDLITDASLTYGYTASEPKIFKDVYSFNNGGEKISGKVNCLLSRVATDLNAANVKSFNYNLIMVGTDNHVFAIDPVTYTIKHTDSDLITGKFYDNFKTSMFFNAGSYASFALFGEGSLYACCDMMDYAYARMAFPGDKTDVFGPNSMSFARGSQGGFAGYNRDAKKFHFARGWNAHQASFDYVTEVNLPFDLAGATCLAAGCTKDMNHFFLMKAGDGSYYIVKITDGNTIVASAIALPTLPDIDKAVSFATLDNANIFYYATDSKIYSIIVSGENATVNALTWKPESTSEKITMIQQYSQAWYGVNQYFSYEQSIPTHRLQLVIVTYNSSKKEGKIYLRPFIVSTGNFNVKSNGTYSGFGEITAIATTLR